MLSVKSIIAVSRHNLLNIINSNLLIKINEVYWVSTELGKAWLRGFSISKKNLENDFVFDYYERFLLQVIRVGSEISNIFF